MTEEKLKIIALQVDGLRKLSAVEMEFAEKGLIQFRGKNGQGKTSILDSFEILLRGTKFVESDMITHGKKKAEIIGQVGEYQITRVITEKSNRIEIKNKDGLKLGKPQEFLDTLINGLTFNPRPFLNKSPEKKLRFMMDFLKIDFTEIDTKIEKKEEDRLVIGRVVKNYGEIAPVEKAEKVSISDLISRKNEITATNESRKADYDEEKEKLTTEIREFNEKQDYLQSDITKQEDVIAGLKYTGNAIDEDIARLLARKEACLESQEVEVAALVKLELPEPKKSYEVEIEVPVLEDTLAIDDEITDAEETNLKADAYNTFLTKKREKGEEQQKYDEHTEGLEDLREQKKQILRDVKTPIEGLEIREDGLYYDNIFSENWAESDALRISSELCIAMQPTLRALFLDQGECYDSDHLKLIEKWALKNDVQFFLTTVSNTKGTSESDVFYIEEGSIV